MKKPNRYRTYECPHGKGKGFTDGVLKKSFVQGTYCKNNCELYMKGCKKWK